MNQSLPVAIIGAGPVGLTAAAHLAVRSEPFVVLERGGDVGHAVGEWGHVRLFSPWRYCIDNAARSLLEGAGWTAPDLDALPTGRDLRQRYITPLARHPAIAPHVLLNAQVAGVSREGMDKTVSLDRTRRPFVLRLSDGRTIHARAVIDASGTWFQPNPLGADGLPAAGEAGLQDRVTYGIPDVPGKASEYAGHRTLVVGSGHSAINTILALLELRQSAPQTDVFWAMRSSRISRVFGGGDADALPARGALGTKAGRAIETGDVRVLAPFRITELKSASEGLIASGQLAGKPFELEVDQLVVATGFRPDLAMLRELHLSLDPALESAGALGPLIDPNIHSCGTVPPHGAKELAHPEPDFYVIGSKSYGRAPTFLMATGFEQARSVVAHLVGDYEAATRVELVLPETGVCGSDPTRDAQCCSTAPSPGSRFSPDELLTMVESAQGCCGGPAATGVDACCELDAQAKAAGQSGCGCSTNAPHSLPSER